MDATAQLRLHLAHARRADDLAAALLVYGQGGVMSFIVGQQGIVFQKDLGKETAKAAAAITAYDPDETWAPTAD